MDDLTFPQVCTVVAIVAAGAAVLVVLVTRPRIPPTVLVPGKVKPPQPLYGKCWACGCVFSVRKQDGSRRTVHGGGPGLWHPCPTEGCDHNVPLSEFHPDVPLLPPRGGSGVASTRKDS